MWGPIWEKVQKYKETSLELKWRAHMRMGTYVSSVEIRTNSKLSLEILTSNSYTIDNYQIQLLNKNPVQTSFSEEEKWPPFLKKI